MGDMWKEVETWDGRFLIGSRSILTNTQSKTFWTRASLRSVDCRSYIIIRDIIARLSAGNKDHVKLALDQSQISAKYKKYVNHFVY